jgi:hypothetical protein
MRATIFSTLLVAGGLVLAGCATNSTNDVGEGAETSSSSDAITRTNVLRQLPGDWKSDALYPVFNLGKDGQYSWDTGIRCITTPCPSGDAGRYYLEKYSGVFYVYMLSYDYRTERYLRVDVKSDTVVSLTGVYGATGVFTKKTAGGTGCELVRCAAGTVCDDSSGTAQCIASCSSLTCATGEFCDITMDPTIPAKCTPYATCATTKCAGGNYCVDQGVMCIPERSCPPSKPACIECPPSGTWINCMPGTSGTDPRCEPAVRESITLNCEGVGFAF